MSKKILAVVLAVCMIASTCILFASAASLTTKVALKTGDYVDAEGNKVVTHTVTVTAKTGTSLNSTATEVNADNIDQIVTIKVDNATTSYSTIAPYIKIASGTVSFSSNVGTANISFDQTEKNTVKALQVAADTPAGTTIDYTSLSDVQLYNVPGDVTVSSIKAVTKLSSLTMGVRFFGAEYKNLVAAEIAKVTATVNRKSGAVQPITTSVTNTINDLLPGDTVTLTTSLKDDAEKEFYGFNCWVDGSGNVISTDPTITYTADGNSAAIYAGYVELKSRFVVDYSSEGKGKVVYEEAREVFDGDAQISVMEGRNATFTFVPDEGYEVSKVLIDGKNVISFLSLIDSTDLLKSLKILINASNKETYSYTFEKVAADHTIDVVFAPIENFEAPSGLELPTVEAEGIELETGAADENGGSDGTTVPAENGAAANGSAVGGVVNPATGSGSAIAVFAVLTVAAGAAFVTMKKKED